MIPKKRNQVLIKHLAFGAVNQNIRVISQTLT